MVGAIPSIHVSLRRWEYSRIPGSPPRQKTDLSPPFYPQPVAERGGTPQFLNKPRLNRWVARAAALTATPQVDKVVLSRLD